MTKTIMKIFSLGLLSLNAVLWAEPTEEKQKIAQSTQKMSTFITSASYSYLSGNVNWNQTMQDYFMMFRFPSSKDLEFSEILKIKKIDTKDYESKLFPESLTQMSIISHGKLLKSDFLFMINSSSDKIFYSKNEVNLYANFYYPFFQTQNSTLSLGFFYATGDLYDYFPVYPIPFFSYYYKDDNLLLVIGLVPKIQWKIIPKYLTFEMDGQPVVGSYSFSVSSFPLPFFKIKLSFLRKDESFTLSERLDSKEKVGYDYLEAGPEMTFFLSKFFSLSLSCYYHFKSSLRYYEKDNLLSSERIRISSNTPDSLNYQASIRLVF